ncbi:hypothetical protein [Novosphingobium sp. MBES04]|uniref:hypothetical protein n=1 Tax=Novosphingobium sp. MBES04 TaxID=1206458 RepID=UPI00057C7824|nr:hypothetical protein [Novosphingobium sp. MBES04]GAM06357.1 hypothetical protein MBENS4_3354 [Novosphingobium sp. MBES04]
MAKIATLANGQPAHTAGKPRQRQSHYDALRLAGERYRQLKASEEGFSDEMGLRREPGIAKGIAWMGVTLVAVGLWSLIFFAIQAN